MTKTNDKQVRCNVCKKSLGDTTETIYRYGDFYICFYCCEDTGFDPGVPADNTY